ncbi:MAG: DUF3379 family protein [Betaproteobacteria bacterium]
MSSSDSNPDIKRELLADPRRTSPAIDAAIANDPGLAELRQQLQAGNDRLAKAFADVAAPPGLADRVILQVRYRRRSKWAAGIAASIVMAATVLFAVRPETPSPIAVAMLDHVADEAGEWADNGSIPTQTVTASLGRLGVGFHDVGYHVRHLTECVVAGRTGRHLVMSTPKGLVSFLIMPTMNGEVGKRLHLSKGTMQAVLRSGERPGAVTFRAVAIGAFADQSFDQKTLEAMMTQMFPAAVA